MVVLVLASFDGPKDSLFTAPCVLWTWIFVAAMFSLFLLWARLETAALL